MRRVAVAVFLLAVLLFPRVAAAATQEEDGWYGDRTLLADAASIGVGLASVYDAGQQRLVMPTGPTLRLEAVAGVGYLLGGPVVHWAHENVKRGFGSLGLRLVIPAAAGLLTLASLGEKGAGSSERTPIVLMGVGAGAAGAMVLDATILARHPARDTDHAKSTWHIFPLLSTRKGNATFGIGGVFD